MSHTPEAILRFWFEELTPKDWWQKSDAFDASLRERFGTLQTQAALGELYPWRATAHGRLAEVIVLDQFSRNIFRDLPESFAYDPMALALAQEAILQGNDQQLTPQQRTFLYIPFMHSESRLIHEQAVALYSQPGMPEDNLNFEIKHKAIIDRFGRYPHRNEILGRNSTDEELAFLKEPGSSF